MSSKIGHVLCLKRIGCNTATACGEGSQNRRENYFTNDGRDGGNSHFITVVRACGNGWPKQSPFEIAQNAQSLAASAIAPYTTTSSSSAAETSRTESASGGNTKRRTCRRNGSKKSSSPIKE